MRDIVLNKTKIWLHYRWLWAMILGLASFSIFLNMGQPRPLFAFIIAKLFTNSITTDVLTIDWACLRLVDKVCLQVRDQLNKGSRGRCRVGLHLSRLAWLFKSIQDP